MKKLFSYGLVICFYLLFVGGVAFGESINIVPYYATGGDGDWWQYTYDETLTHPEPPNFTVYQDLLKSGPYEGKYQRGDIVFPSGYDDDEPIRSIWDADSTNLYLYWDNVNGDYVPPVVKNGIVELNTMIPEAEGGNYVSVLSDFTVAAGTFSNILVQVHLDNAYGRNDFNDTLYDYIGLPTDIDYAVTHVRLWALGIGQILELDIDSASGNRVFQYELAATSVPLPAAWFLFGSGVIGLFGVRRFF